jgi:hypothetical protein
MGGVDLFTFYRLGSWELKSLWKNEISIYKANHYQAHYEIGKVEGN